MIKILGIDPGSRVTGFGIIEADGAHFLHLTSGSIVLEGETLAIRLGALFQALTEIIAGHGPQAVAIEQVFVHRNVDSALKLGQARGAAICAAATQRLPLYEYTPREVKQAVVGKGGAAKEQIQYMVRLLLNLAGPVEPDAADALAVALCHSHRQQGVARIPAVQGWHRGRWR